MNFDRLPLERSLFLQGSRHWDDNGMVKKKGRRMKINGHLFSKLPRSPRWDTWCHVLYLTVTPRIVCRGGIRLSPNWGALISARDSVSSKDMRLGPFYQGIVPSSNNRGHNKAFSGLSMLPRRIEMSQVKLEYHGATSHRIPVHLGEESRRGIHTFTANSVGSWKVYLISPGIGG